MVTSPFPFLPSFLPSFLPPSLPPSLLFFLSSPLPPISTGFSCAEWTDLGFWSSFKTWLHGYSLLGVGFLVTSRGEVGFYGYSSLGERVGCMVTPVRREDGLHGFSPLGERVGCRVTYRWGSWFYGYILLEKFVSGLLPAGGEGRLHGYFPLGKLVLWLLPAGEVGFMVTSCWGSWFCGYFLLGKLVFGYSPLGERVVCMVTSRWRRGWVAWLLPAGGVG